ncbi:hypothetical protein BDV96DRAFT_610219 [Lophiotrema nucula]|uniref:DUF7730 domain-containing protein n=1 Tax=Lophiotrema nucula TaxID=690887 RepID=A0A6A5ZMU9_9PLEO|nr:hypothetical protein BDV96DRAFT_610219 [Lophiotrema nucula]
MLDAPAAPLAPPARPRPASHAQHPAEMPPRDPSFSLLLSLPRELRDRVCLFALTSPFPFWWPSQTSPRHDVAVSLLTTSRQVYEEAAPILYSANKFLFTHPSDCNVFRVIASPQYSALITSVCFRIREKDLRLWTTYLGSKSADRSLKHDLPKLRSLWIFLRCGNVATGAWGHLGGHGLPAGIQAQVQAVQNAIGQQVQALQQQVQNLQQAAGAPVTPPNPQPAQQLAFNTNTPQPAQFPGAPGQQWNNNAVPPPPPPAPAPPPFYTSFLRWEREMGLENLCLSLQETRPIDAEVKIVCIMRLPSPEVHRLTRLYPDELAVDRNGDARTRFRKLHGVEVSLEISGYETQA